MSIAASTACKQRPQGLRTPRTIRYESIVGGAVYLFLFCGSISLIEPSPYDFMSLVAIPLWFFGGFRLHRSLIFVLGVWTLYNVVGFISLAPYWHEDNTPLYQFQTLYLYVTVVFFTIYFSERSTDRMELALRGYTAGCIFASLVGLVGYVDIAGIGQYTTMYEGRVSGTFKDPNVLGSYLVLSAVYIAQSVMLGTARRVWLSVLGLLVILAAVLLAFSRGSWGATIVALGMMTTMSFLTTTGRIRRRIVIVVTVCLVLCAIMIIVILADERTRELLTLRFSATQDYDVGETGRFGNQLRSLTALLDLPEGYGPLRFRLTYGLEPHNSYIGAFANYGWAGGFLWLLVCGATIWVGFRLMWIASPMRRYAHIFVPTTFVLLMQGLQIDVDHWRQLYLCFGAVWGMEAARIKLNSRNAASGGSSPLAPKTEATAI